MTLRFADIRAGYPRRRAVLGGEGHLVEGRLEAGRLTAIVGPNGAGKSTLLRVLAGVHRPEGGRVWIEPEGLDVRSARATVWARRLALIPQRGGPAFDYRVGEVVALGRFASGVAGVGRLVGEALDRVGLASRANRRFGELSAGQQQRVAVARALVQLAETTSDPWADLSGRVLLADEPIAALDPAWISATMGRLRQAARAGAAVGVVLHDLSAAATWADDAIALSADGAVAHAGKASDVLTSARLEPVFGCELVSGEVSGVRVLTPAGTR